MQRYHFSTNTSTIDVIAEVENQFHVSLDVVYAGIIFPEFTEDIPFLIWKSSDLIPEDLIQKIGKAIENEDRLS